MSRRATIGIDEVGRGALAGPVVVVAAIVIGHLGKEHKELGILRDSKKLAAKKRELWCNYFRNHPKIRFAVARVYPRQIEKRNISGAANLAAFRAYRKLSSEQDAASKSAVFLDGGLFLRGRNWQEENIRHAKTMVKADEKVVAVMAASIIAKVERDRFMLKLAKRHPGYGFEVHKGYGTRFHRRAIAQLGPSAVHRLTFIQNKSKV